VPAADETVRPTWRGLIHKWATLAFVHLFVVLIALAEPGGDRVAVTIYALGVTTMLGVSATYHSGRAGPAAMRRLKRLDHSTILLAIAGSYTAVTALALTGSAASRLITIVWIAAAIGIAIRMLWIDAPYPVAAAVYLVVGWIALIAIGDFVDALTSLELALVAGGGLLYTAGGVVYALHRPNPKPEVFGYHEVFHALVVAGASLHYLAVLSLAL
jgi:hemolysin III